MHHITELGNPTGVQWVPEFTAIHSIFAYFYAFLPGDMYLLRGSGWHFFWKANTLKLPHVVCISIAEYGFVTLQLLTHLRAQVA